MAAENRGRPDRFRAKEIQRRREEVARMLAQGIPRPAIAERLGETRSVIDLDAQKIIATRRAQMPDYADQIIARQSAELELIREKAWSIARRNHPVVTKEGQVAHDDNGNVIYDTAPNIAALQLLLKTQEREARMMGTDQPKRLDIDAKIVTLDLVKASVLELRKQVGELEGS